MSTIKIRGQPLGWDVPSGTSDPEAYRRTHYSDYNLYRKLNGMAEEAAALAEATPRNPTEQALEDPFNTSGMPSHLVPPSLDQIAAHNRAVAAAMQASQ